MVKSQVQLLMAHLCRTCSFFTRGSLSEFYIKTPNWLIRWTMVLPVLAFALFNWNADLTYALTCAYFDSFRDVFFFLSFFFQDKMSKYLDSAFIPAAESRIPGKPAGTMTSVTYLLLSPISSGRCWGCFFSLGKGQYYSILAQYYRLRELVAQ